MKKSCKRILAFVLTLLLISVMFAGCGGQGTSSDKVQQTDSGKDTGTQSSNKGETSKEKTKFTWATWVLGPVDNNSYAEQKLEEAFPDVNFEFWAFERGTWIDQINTRVAGGDIPDIIYRDSQGVVVDYAKQGILAEVPYGLVKEHAPNIYKASLDYGQEVWLACNVDGKNYGLPIMQPSQTRPFTNAWRKDWLNNVGITKVPETIEEFEDAFKKFVNEDPDGNGQKDTYGLSFRGKDLGSYLFMAIMGAYGVFPGQWMLQPDGSVKWGITTEGAKQALITLNRWYKEGIIDPEFVTTDNAIIKQKWANGKIGYMTFGTWYRWIPGGEYYEALKAVNPNAEMVMGPAPKGPEGRYGYMNWGTITSSITFGKHLEKEPQKLQKGIQIIDRVMSDKELYANIKFGKEGEHWSRNAEHNGVEPIPPYNDLQKTGIIGSNFFGSLAGTPEVQSFYSRKDEPELYKYAIAGNVKNGKDYFTWISLFTNPEVSKQAQDAGPISIKWAIDFIIGAKPIDQFDQFVKEWEAAGGKLLTEDANRAYKEGAVRIEEMKKQFN
ncbi:MAG: hypothetical protein HPY74_19000 [Firmicutes bacterium]|nr:hypothetical protein [Bacillota bacterium]